MDRLKIITIVGTRPEVIRLSSIIKKLNIYFEHLLLHTGQNNDYELNEIFFDDLELKKPDFYLNSARGNFAETLGSIIIETDKILASEKPDAVLILGDTNSCLSAIPAKKRKIPIFHMEAGNRCFDQRVPEETNRKIVDHISDINLTYSSIAREYLISEGLPAENIIKVGSPMREVIENNIEKITGSSILKKLKLEKNNFFLVSCHREENIENNERFSEFIEILNFLANEYKIDVIVSTHPRTRKKIDESNPALDNKVKFLKPLSFTEYNKLQISSRAVLSDSGTISEESSILNFPALNIRESHERPEAMEQASVMLVGFNKSRIKQSLKILDDQSRDKKRTLNVVEDYSDSNISDKIIRIIISHIDFINTNTWHK
tara:strand:- start:5770 stop:6897 length:1128 start_codon:yes stop_codon:yes gene_type:complete